MVGLLIGGDTYGRLDGRMLLRKELRDLVEAQASEMLPGLTVVAPDLVKAHDNDEFTVDVVAIDWLSPRWWVGMVRPAVSAFQSEVLYPVQWAQRVAYLSEDAARIADLSGKPFEQVRELITNVVPQPVVFLSDPDPRWFEQIQDAGGLLAVLELFEGRTGQRVIRVNGQMPSTAGELVGSVTRMAGSRVLRSDTVFLADEEETCEVEWANHVTKWKATIAEGVMLLRPPRSIEFPEGRTIALYRLAAGRYIAKVEDGPE